jgi:hypothetical protein
VALNGHDLTVPTSTRHGRLHLVYEFSLQFDCQIIPSLAVTHWRHADAPGCLVWVVDTGFFRAMLTLVGALEEDGFIPATAVSRHLLTREVRCR